MALAFETDGGAAALAAFGLIVLQTDETIEAELAPVFSSPGVALYHTRLASSPEVNTKTLRQMEQNLPGAIALLPRSIALDVVAYACTSGATVIGSEKISAMVNATHPSAKTTDPMTAVIAALHHLRAKSIAVITPYVPEVSQTMRAHLQQQGFQIAALASFEQTKEATVARITETSLLDAIAEIDSTTNADAIFVSCTNLRSFQILAKAEARINKPVVSSNQALAWHMLTLAGIDPRNMGPGRLFATAPPPIAG